jgi:hypothetical protein
VIRSASAESSACGAVSAISSASVRASSAFSAFLFVGGALQRCHSLVERLEQIHDPRRHAGLGLRNGVGNQRRGLLNARLLVDVACAVGADLSEMTRLP